MFNKIKSETVLSLREFANLSGLGAFLTVLLDAFCVADSGNRGKIAEGWPHVAAAFHYWDGRGYLVTDPEADPKYLHFYSSGCNLVISDSNGQLIGYVESAFSHPKAFRPDPHGEASFLRDDHILYTDASEVNANTSDMEPLMALDWGEVLEGDRLALADNISVILAEMGLSPVEEEEAEACLRDLKA